MPGRWGYFVDKEPYDKICIPNHLAHDLAELARTVRRPEFMHAITLNLTNGHSPRWLEEAMSTYAEGRAPAQPTSWRSAHDLEVAVSADNRDGSLHHSISDGYAQSHRLAIFLSGVGGDSREDGGAVERGWR